MRVGHKLVPHAVVQTTAANHGTPCTPWIHQGLVSSMVVRLDKTMHVGYVPDVSLTI